MRHSKTVGRMLSAALSVALAAAMVPTAALAATQNGGDTPSVADDSRTYGAADALAQADGSLSASHDMEVVVDVDGDVSTGESDTVSGTWWVTIPDSLGLRAAEGTEAGRPGTYSNTATISYGGEIGTAQKLNVYSSDFELVDAKGWSAPIAGTRHADTGLDGLDYDAVRAGGSGTTAVSADVGPGLWSGVCTYSIQLGSEGGGDPDTGLTAFAVYSADDNSLNFYKRDAAPAEAESFEGLTATAVYTGIETDTYSSSSSVPWYSNATSITSVNFVDEGIAPVSTACWFYEMNNASLTTIGGLDKLDTANVTDMRWMFYKCEALTNLDVSNFDTSNVTDMSWMFDMCRALTSLDVSGWNTSNVTYMRSMFYWCDSLTSLDVSGFDTANVTDMGAMFDGCRVLTTLDVSHFDTSKVTNMCWMFWDCYVVTSLDVSHFDTANVTNMNNMFNSCQTLTSLDVSNFDTSKVTDMNGMFQDCSGLTSLDLSHFDTANVTDMSRMFGGCSKLTSLDLSSFDTSKVTNMNRMFYGYNCTTYTYGSALTSLDLSSFDTSKVTNMEGMFQDCQVLTTIYVSDKWTTASVSSSTEMFYHCFKLTNYNSLETDKTNAHYGSDGYLTPFGIAWYAWSGTGFDASGYTCKAYRYAKSNGTIEKQVASGIITRDAYTDDSITLTATFSEDWAAAQTETITKSAFAVYSADDNSLNFYKRVGAPADGSTFNGKTATAVYRGIETDTYTSSTRPWYSYASDITSVSFVDEGIAPVSTACWFYEMNNTSLTTIGGLDKLDTSKVTNMNYMFYYCSSLTSLDVSHFDTSNVTNMRNMFTVCSKLTSLDLSSFDTSKVTSMSYMLSGCTALSTIYVSGKWSTASVTSSTKMFNNCSKLPNFNSSKIDKTRANCNPNGYLTYKAAPAAAEGTGFSLLGLARMFSDAVGELFAA